MAGHETVEGVEKRPRDECGEEAQAPRAAQVAEHLQCRARPREEALRAPLLRRFVPDHRVEIASVWVPRKHGPSEGSVALRKAQRSASVVPEDQPHRARAQRALAVVQQDRFTHSMQGAERNHAPPRATIALPL